jgi:hypothetical protein
MADIVHPSPRFEPTSLEFMHNDAVNLMADQNVAPETLKLGVAILALNDVKKAKRAALRYAQQPALNNDLEEANALGLLPPYPLTPVDAAVLTSAWGTIEASHDLANSFRNRTRAKIAATGLGIGFTVFGALGAYTAHSNDAEIARGRTWAPDQPRRIHSHFGLTWDSSILTGDGKSEKGVFKIFAKIPGVPDFEKGPQKVTSYEAEKFSYETQKIESKVTLGTATNDVASNLQLTGEEYAQDVTAAIEFLDKIPDGAVLGPDVFVTGLASDELNCEVGTPNPTQLGALARARGETARLALFNEGMTAGVLPENIKTVEDIELYGLEKVLTADEVSQLNRLLAGRDFCTEMKLFNDGTYSDGVLKQFFETNFAAYRGAIMSAETVKTTSTITETKIPETDIQDGKIALGGEFFLFGPSLVALIYSGMFIARRQPQRIRSEAIKRARAAGLFGSSVAAK